MKTLIGTVNIYKSGNRQRILRFYFPKNVIEVLGKSITIDIDKMVIKRASIDDTKTLTIGKFQTTIAIDEDITNYLGHYDLFQKDEDTFKLKRCQATT